MFGSKKNKEKKFFNELVELLSDSGNITKDSALKFVSEYKVWILHSHKRELDAFGALWHISSQSMERISAAHATEMYEEAAVVPSFMLLVALQVAKTFESAGVPVEEINANMQYFLQVLKLPINPSEPGRTYTELLHELVEQANQGHQQVWPVG